MLSVEIQYVDSRDADRMIRLLQLGLVMTSAQFNICWLALYRWKDRYQMLPKEAAALLANRIINCLGTDIAYRVTVYYEPRKGVTRTSYDIMEAQ